jgi:ribosomal-protein-alanine N-acetyltransferase
MKTIVLSSPRLLLRPIKKSDLNDMHLLSSIPEVEKYNTLGMPNDISITRAILKDRLKDNKLSPFNNYTFAIEEKVTGKFIGMFGIVIGRSKQNKAELWYKFHPRFWGLGLATESIHCVLDYCFDELKLHRVEAGCAVENIGSVRVLEKVGMTKEGLARKVLPLDSGWSDGYSFGILSSDERKR